MKQLGLMIDLNRCIGCKTCVVACRNFHELVDHVEAMPNEIPYYLRVEDRWTGVFPNVAVDSWVVPCQHCADPWCVTSCPEDAISRDEQTGIVQIDWEKCNGCNAVPGTLGADKRKHAPCMVECPAHINVESYVGLAAKGKYAEALKVIKDDNPLPAICGRVCHHPCEAVCKRADVDQAVAINAIKRFVADQDLKAESRYVPKLEDRLEEKVAIIGSGPAGLSCAYYLARDGYQVTILEKAPVLGGMLTLGIPAYRMPRDVVNAEIEVIRDMGVTMKTGVELGKDTTIAQLRSEGFGAFLMAIGTQECKQLGAEGEDLEGVYEGLEYLRQTNLNASPPLGKKVAVIGGGNVALDAARTARRLGAEEVFVLYRRGLEEMPSHPEEIADAQDEGIPIHTLTQPVAFRGNDGKVTTIDCIKMRLGEPDASGRPHPEPVPGSEFTVDADAVIVALGEEADWACLTPECACQLTPAGAMEVDLLTLQSGDPDIFAAGDAIRGPSTVIEAIADGKRAAVSIDRYLKGLDLRQGRAKEWVAVDEVQKEKYNPADRAPMPRVEPAERSQDFAEVEQGLAEEMVVQEGDRCLKCGSSCLQACPYGVIQFNPQEGKAHKCDLCWPRIHQGEVPVCVETCLTDAISFGEIDLLRQKAATLGRSIIADLSEESVLYIK
ncbi:MAG: FAD-dependent oxidoreductase [Coriobacteriia bacterium]|nr:FAD-dependent oxidoreductase [Coriobacteriia bacterium]